MVELMLQNKLNMNFNLVEMYNGLLRFNKHILNELAEGLKHLPNLDGVSKGDSLT